jgi:hypothetical protein
MRIMRETAPRTYAWLIRTSDASGVEGEWISNDAPLPEAVVDLLRFAGEVYLPFLVANAEALEKGSDRVSLTLLGRPYTQAPFRYQVKCLRWLREEYAALPGNARDRIDPALRECGVLDALS